MQFVNKKSIKDLIIEHNDLKKDSQVTNDAFENEINKKNEKKELEKHSSWQSQAWKAYQE